MVTEPPARRNNCLEISVREFFIVADSFAAPFVSDRSTHFVSAETAQQALERFSADYKHPCGLYCATAYGSADEFHKGAKPYAQWLCNHEIEMQRLTKDLGCYSMFGHAPGKFEINGEMHIVERPKEGRVV